MDCFGPVCLYVVNGWTLFSCPINLIQFDGTAVLLLCDYSYNVVSDMVANVGVTFFALIKYHLNVRGVMRQTMSGKISPS